MITPKHSPAQQPSVRNQSGYAVLMATVLITAISLLVSVSLITFGIVSSKSSLALEQSAHSRSFADACAETGLRRVRESVNFSGSGSINFAVGNCQYTVIRQGNIRTIQATGTAGTNVRKVLVEARRTGNSLDINSWQEVADF